MTFVGREYQNSLVLAKYAKKMSIKDELYLSLQHLLHIEKEITPFSRLDFSKIPKEYVRIIKHDVERCTENSINQMILKDILYDFYLTHKDYGQGISYIATFLASVCKFEKDIDIKSFVKFHLNFLVKKFDRNIWSPSMVHLYAEKQVIEELFKDSKTEKIFKEKGIDYIFFLQKYINCLFVGTFSYENLFSFFINFFEKDIKYLYQTIYLIILQITEKYNNDFNIILNKLQSPPTEMQNNQVAEIPLKVKKYKEYRIKGENLALIILAKNISLDSDSEIEFSDDEE